MVGLGRTRNGSICTFSTYTIKDNLHEAELSHQCLLFTKTKKDQLQQHCTTMTSSKNSRNKKKTKDCLHLCFLDLRQTKT